MQAFIDTVTGSTGIPPLAGADGTETEFAIKNLDSVASRILARRAATASGPTKWEEQRPSARASTIRSSPRSFATSASR